MRTTGFLVLALLATACTRGEHEPVAAATPAAPAAVAPAAAPAPAAEEAAPARADTAASPSPGFALSPGAAASPGSLEDFEWDLATEAEGPEFEIDAAATSYFAPALATIGFKAKALNGTPPFKFTWDFADGSPKGSGETVTHAYQSVGVFYASVVGEDASGATSRVDFIIRLATPEDFVQRMRLDPALLKTLPSPAGTAATPGP